MVFVGGAGHSGSTLLGLMLGTHPSVFHAGEAEKALELGNPHAPTHWRTCRFCGLGCVVWSDLLADDHDLYEALSRRTNRPIVVDSTKQIGWIDQQAAALRDVVSLGLIVLARDGRAVVNSRLRKYPEVSAHDHAAAWVAKMRRTEKLAARFPGVVHRVRYEELISRPEPVLRGLAGLLAVAFDPAMLSPWSSDQHPLGGNTGTHFLCARERSGSLLAESIPLSVRRRDWYATHPRGLLLDLRWRHEMSPAALTAFQAVAGEVNRAYAWDEPVP